MLPGDPHTEVCALKQGWDQEAEDSKHKVNQISHMLLLINVTVVFWVNVKIYGESK